MLFEHPGNVDDELQVESSLTLCLVSTVGCWLTVAEEHFGFLCSPTTSSKIILPENCSSIFSSFFKNFLNLNLKALQQRSYMHQVLHIKTEKEH